MSHFQNGILCVAFPVENTVFGIFLFRYCARIMCADNSQVNDQKFQ